MRVNQLEATVSQIAPGRRRLRRPAKSRQRARPARSAQADAPAALAHADDRDARRRDGRGSGRRARDPAAEIQGRHGRAGRSAAAARHRFRGGAVRHRRGRRRGREPGRADPVLRAGEARDRKARARPGSGVRDALADGCAARRRVEPVRRRRRRRSGAAQPADLPFPDRTFGAAARSHLHSGGRLFVDRAAEGAAHLERRCRGVSRGSAHAAQQRHGGRLRLARRAHR